MSEIEGRVVAITGASSGIGEATALLLAERGAKVALGARGTERLAALADRIVRAGGDAIYASTDVKRRQDLAALVALAAERIREAAPSEPLTPLYLRRPDAVEPTTRKSVLT